MNSMAAGERERLWIRGEDLNAAELVLVERVRELARAEFSERAAATDRDRVFPAKNVDALRSLGVTAMLLDAKYGGLGMGPEALVRVMEEIAWATARPPSR